MKPHPLVAVAVLLLSSSTISGQSVVAATMRDSSFWPEGIDADPRSGTLYVASVAHRTIGVVNRDGTSRDLLPRDARDLGPVLGVRVDTTRNVLWATISGVTQAADYQPRDSTIAALLEIGLSDGRIRRRWNLPVVRGGHTLGDLAVGPRGDVYITDSNHPVLYRLAPGADTLVAFQDSLFKSLQGLAPTPDGRALYLSDYSHGLLRVDLATNHVTRLADAPGSISVGCDGIVLDRNAIIAVQNGVRPPRIMRFTLNETGTAIARADVFDRNIEVADEPTIGTLLDGRFVYVANSQWDKHDAHGRVIAGHPLTPPIFLSVPLPPR